MTDLPDVAKSLFADGKGLLAADESVHTADARLELYGIKPSAEMRRQDRDLFLEAPGVEKYLSGVILFAETFEQEGSDHKLFNDSLVSRGIQAGIKVDEGTEPFPDSPKELLTKGLIGLPDRFKEFKDKGASFAKWRAALKIDGDKLPSAQAVLENSRRLAKYAREAQEYGVVPIVEPEVLLEGAHSRMRSKEVLHNVLGVLFDTLKEQAVDMPGLILKTSMALSGNKSGKMDTPDEVAEATVDVLMQSVPRDVGGIVFLSGGQTPDQATANLAAIMKRAHAASAPWPLTFSYARALQEEALAIWKGDPANLDAARAAFILRLEKVAQALRV